jgi:hypothetical protein
MTLAARVVMPLPFSGASGIKAKRNKSDKIGWAESRILLSLAAGPGADSAIRDSLVDSLDWSRLIALSIREGTQPVVGCRLRRLGAGRIPRELLEAMEPLERITAFRQQYLERRLTDAVDILTGAGIPVLLLKGAGLACTVYKSFAERPMGDIDVLVRPADALQAASLLGREGWRQRFGANADPLYREMHHLPPLIDTRAPKLGVGLEIHTDIIAPSRNPFRFSGEDLWRSAQPIKGMPSGTFAPDRVSALLHTSIHFAWSHTFVRSAWRTFRDVAVLSDDHGLDWDEVAQKAHSARADSACYWTLRLARRVIELDLPPGILDRLRPRKSAFLLNVLERHLLLQLVETKGSCPSMRVQRAAWIAAMQPTRAERGSSVPWENDAHWTLSEITGQETNVLSRIRRNTIPAWTGYLRFLLQ